MVWEENIISLLGDLAAEKALKDGMVSSPFLQQEMGAENRDENTRVSFYLLSPGIRT